MDETVREYLDHPAVTGVLFYPRRIRESEVPDLPFGRVERIPAGGQELGAYWFHPHEGAPTVLFFHGNGEVMTDYLSGFHRHLADLGLNVLFVDYRGYGLSSGAPSLSRLLEDARAAWDHATGTMGLAPGALVIFGRSLGSLAALEAASVGGRSARALVLESGIARFDEWVGNLGPWLLGSGVDVENLRRALGLAFDQKAKLEAFEGPTLVLHAPEDEIVPVDHGRLFAAWGDPARTHAHVFPRGGHNDIHFVNEAAYFQVLGDFLGRVP